MYGFFLPLRTVCWDPSNLSLDGAAAFVTMQPGLKDQDGECEKPAAPRSISPSVDQEKPLTNPAGTAPMKAAGTTKKRMTLADWLKSVIG